MTTQEDIAIVRSCRYRELSRVNLAFIVLSIDYVDTIMAYNLALPFCLYT